MKAQHWLRVKTACARERDKGSESWKAEPDHWRKGHLRPDKQEDKGSMMSKPCYRAGKHAV